MSWRSRLTTLVSVGVATLVVVGAMIWLSGWLRTGRVEPGVVKEAGLPTTRPVVVVQRVVRPRHADEVGSVQAENRAVVAARLTANILEVKVQANETVKEGQVLIILDDRDLTARLGQAKGALKAAEAKRDRMQIERDRIESMAREGVATKYELDTIRQQAAESLAEVARAQQAVSEAEVALSDAQVKSPMKGIVIDRLAEPGDQASPGKPLLTVYDPARLRLEANVREGYIGRLKVGQDVPVLVDREQRKGIVEQIVPAADPQSRSFLVKVRIVDPTGLYPGMYGRVRLPLESQEQLEIPLSAVEQVGQLSLVQVLSGGRPQRRAVRLGHAASGAIEVLSGLQAGEQVLLNPETER